MMTEHEPHFANWDQDATAVERRYDQQVPAIVGPTLVASAYAVGDVYASVPDDDWGRKGIRSDGSVFNIASLGRYHLHDIEHHLHDVATLAERVTIGSYDAYAGEYASGTSAMPDEVTDNLNHFVDLVGTEARVLEIGSRPRARRRWPSSRSASASGAPTSPARSSSGSAPPGTSPTSSTRSATTSPTRCAAGRRTTVSGPARPCSTSRGSPCRPCSPGSPLSPGPGAPST